MSPPYSYRTDHHLPPPWPRFCLSLLCLCHITNPRLPSSPTPGFARFIYRREIPDLHDRYDFPVYEQLRAHAKYIALRRQSQGISRCRNWKIGDAKGECWDLSVKDEGNLFMAQLVGSTSLIYFAERKYIGKNGTKQVFLKWEMKCKKISCWLYCSRSIEVETYWLSSCRSVLCCGHATL